MKQAVWLTLIVFGALALGCDGSGGNWASSDDGGATAQDGAQAGEGLISVNLDFKPPPMDKEPCDGFDNDKDGHVDEGCQCSPGATKPCFDGLPRPIKGLCKMGSMTCVGTAEFGSWGVCKGAVRPQPEICGDGLDQDCDGKDLPCPPKCGDGKCNNNESCKTCPQDCGACQPYCGDGKCNGGEKCTSCPKDCGPCPTACETFTFAVNARPVDIVWMIDQSGSMSTEIAGVKSNMNAFSGYINGTKIDYHVIVLARRGTNTYDICIPPPLGGPNCGDGPRFKQVNQAVYSTDSLTKIQQNITAIEGFMRPNSLRIFVEVSDDNSYLKAAGFHAWIKARNTAYNDYIFHSIVGLSSGGCVAKVGKEYIDLSNWTKGQKFHICNANWNTLFNALGKQVANIATTQYKLKHKPIVATMKVTYNGVQKQHATHWVYDAGNQQLKLVGQLPGPGTQIKACYQWVP